MAQSVALARWIADSGPRQVTPRLVLRRPDLPAAAGAIGVPVPDRVRSAADVPALHRPWCVALAAGLLRADAGTVRAGPALAGWPPADAVVLSAWLAGLGASSAAEAGLDPDEQDDALCYANALLGVLRDDEVPAGLGLLQAVRHEAMDLCEEFDLDGSYIWTGGEKLLSRTAGRLACFGAVSGDDVLAGGCAITPLGRWAAWQLRAELAGSGDDLTAAELIAELAEDAGDGWDELAWDWLDAQPDRAEAAREVLRAGAPMEPRLRWIAAEVAAMLGEDALPVWREMVSAPGIGPHARYELYQMGAGPEPSDAEWLWLAVESAAAGLAGKGPDEAVTILCDALGGETPGASGLDHHLAAVRGSDHPSAKPLARAIAGHVASAGSASLSVNQCLRLKITLRHWRPPVWRTVLLPATASLSQLHEVIQLLYGWDGDHLHAFRAGRAVYSDPDFGLEETRDEQRMAVRDALAAAGGKMIYEYDFGAGWTHEVALQKQLPRDPAAAFPECVKFSGDSPAEYPEEESWDGGEAGEDETAEGRPAKGEPFDLAAVNRKLAALPGR